MRKEILGTVAAATLFGSGLTHAVPITTELGLVTIGTDTYNVSLLYDSDGVPELQTFNALNPSTTFTDAASALLASEALLLAFGFDFVWNPASTGPGVRVVFDVTATDYSAFTLGTGINDILGPFATPRDQLNFFSFAQFELVAVSVPEPGSLALLGLGLAGLGFARRRKLAG